MSRDRGGRQARLRRAVKGLLISSPGRDGWQRPAAVIGALGIRPGDRIADLGAGTGYFTVHLARATGPNGITYAVDTDEDMLDAIEEAAARAGLANIRPIRADGGALALSERVDLAFLCNVYHHLPDQRGYFARLAAQLAPGGRVAIVEAMPGGRMARLFGHVTPPGRIREDMQAAGYRLESAPDFLVDRVRQSFQVFTRSEAPRAVDPIAARRP
ncbi:MAG: class I SAM-dependent methyltransferase [Chloroflexi bacterium]|nr:class I SAM-dependent methyltransferase [Chloroflexota bacterium]